MALDEVLAASFSLVAPHLTERQPSGEPERVDLHDFADPTLGTAIPYGVYDVGANLGWVGVGTDHDIAAFAVQTLRRWWQQVGSRSCPQAERLLVCADAGGSNGCRVRAWKTELARLAIETGLTITVCHLPPGTSKWNRFEHRLFSAISMNWRGPAGKPRDDRGADRGDHHADRLAGPGGAGPRHPPAEVKVRDEELAAVPLVRHAFHGEWNYTIQPAANKPPPTTR